MDKIAAFIVGLFQELKSPIRWIAIMLTPVVIVFILFGYERLAGQFYYGRLEKKVSVLKELQAIANQGIDKNQELYPIYRSALEELAHGEGFSLALPYLPTPDFTDPMTFLKGVSGAFLWILVLIFGLPTEAKKPGRISAITIAVAVVVTIFALIFGWIGIMIPSILNPLVNIIGFPLLQFAVTYRLIKKKPATTPQVSE